MLLEQDASTRTFSKDELVFAVGDEPRHLYVLMSGSVKLFNQRKGTGKEETVCLIRPQGFFCLSPVINQEAFHINAKALEKTSLLLIPQEALHKLIDQSHAFSKRLIRFLARKECDLCEEVCDLSLSTTKERLAKYILQHFQELDRAPVFSLGLSQADLASYLGTVRETVSRDLADLKKAGVIEYKKRQLRVLDPQELSQIAYGSRESSTAFKILSDS